MFRRRRIQFVALLLTAWWPVATMLAVCHVGHDHTHSHADASSGVSTEHGHHHAHAGHDHRHHGHHHDRGGSDETEHRHPHRHDSDDCESCRFLSLSTLAVTVTAAPALVELADCPAEAVPLRPELEPQTTVSLRGPPLS